MTTEELVEALLTDDVASIAGDAMSPMLIRRGLHLALYDRNQLWEDAIVAVLEYLGVEIPA